MSRYSKDSFNCLQMYWVIIYYQCTYRESLSSSTSSLQDYESFITLQLCGAIIVVVIYQLMDQTVPDSAAHEYQGGMGTRTGAFIRALRLSRALCIFRTHIEFKWELPSTSSWQHFGIMMLDSTQMKGLNATREVPEPTPPHLFNAQARIRICKYTDSNQPCFTHILLQHTRC